MHPSKAKLFILVLLLTASLSLSAAGCGGKRETLPPATVDEIRIGVFEPLTGPDAVPGQLALEGFALANHLRGAALNKKVRLIQADAGPDAASAAAAVKRLIEQDQVVAVLGSYGNAYAAAGMAEAVKAGLPVVVDAAPGTAVTAQGNVARVNLNEREQGRLLAGYAVRTLQVTKVGVVVLADQEQSRAVADACKGRLSEIAPGLVTVTEATVTPTAPDFKDQFAPVLSMAPDVIVTAGAPDEAVKVIKQLRALGYWRPILSSDSLDLPSFSALAGREGEGVIFTSCFALDVATGVTGATPGVATTPAASTAGSTFVSEYRSRYTGKQPVALTALAYDAYNVLLDAIERAGSTDAQAIGRALSATRTFDGATGSLAFGGGTDLERGGVIKQIKSGAVVTVQVMPAE